MKPVRPLLPNAKPSIHHGLFMYAVNAKQWGAQRQVVEMVLPEGRKPRKHLRQEKILLSLRTSRSS